jgi:predicted amidohydrolase
MKTVGYYQFRPEFGRVERNLRKVVSAIQAADADLLVLPELAFTGYYFASREEAAKLAQPVAGSEIIAELSRIANERKMVIVTGFAEAEGAAIYNSSVMISPSGDLHTYRKLHLFNREKEWFDPGNLPLKVYEENGMRLGMMVCFDWVFPEVTRTLAIRGAEIISHPSNLVLAYCQQTMLSRCIENRVFAVTANRYGADVRAHGSLKFTGKSQIAGPKGEILNRAVSQRAVLFTMKIDPSQSHDKNMTPLNHLHNDRRPEFYQD